MRWHYRDPPLVWLFPLSYALHILEEWFGGFPEWVGLVAGSELPRAAFFAINAVALVTMIVATRAATASEKNGWVAVALPTILFANAVAHVLGSVLTETYSPGLFTSVVLYFPIAQLALMRAWAQSRRAMFVRGVMTGLVVHAAVVVIAWGFARW